MGGCFSANREITKKDVQNRDIFHRRMTYEGGRNTIFENMYAYAEGTDSDMRRTDSTNLWEDVQCYGEQSNTTLFHSMKQDIPWENASAQPSAEFLKIPAKQCTTADSEVQRTFDLNSPLEESLAQSKHGKPLTWNGKTGGQSWSSMDEFDEPRRSTSSFNDLVSEKKIKGYNPNSTFVNTVSGRWAVVVQDHKGLDGENNVPILLKPLDGTKPMMRAHSSFEIRNLASFKLQLSV